MPGSMITYVNGIPCSLTIIVSTITACIVAVQDCQLQGCQVNDTVKKHNTLNNNHMCFSVLSHLNFQVNYATAKGEF